MLERLALLWGGRLIWGRQMMNWLRQTPAIPFGIIAIILALAPFSPEPHLIEKLKMLGAGTLTRPLDIFDLFLHGTPLALFMVKIFIADRRGSSNSADGE